jgi:PAS domain S-box-containing protein
MDTMDSLQTSIDFEELIETLGDGVVVADTTGVIRLWNAAAERIFGFTKSEALDKSLDLIIPERWRARHWAGYEGVMASGKTRYAHDELRVPALHKDGRALSIAFTVTLLYDAEHKVSGIAAAVRDDTARFAEERELRKQLAELEEKAARQTQVPKPKER